MDPRWICGIGLYELIVVGSFTAAVPKHSHTNEAMKHSDSLIIELILSSHVSELMVENFLACS